MIDDIVGSLLIQPHGNTTFMANFYDRIPINPSPAELNAGSRLVDSSVIAADAICTICQEREQPAAQETSGTWRQLVSCQHTFHKNCIDRWFTENVLCPVCRADIRVVTTAQTQPGQSSAAPETTPASPP